MDVSGSSPSMDAGMFALKQASSVKNEQVLGALGMTPQTQKAEQEIDASIQQSQLAKATGQGVNVDLQA